MIKFKVDDRVRCNTSIHKNISHGDFAIVTGISGPNMNLDCSPEYQGHPYAMGQFELAWTPSNGEEIEVSNDGYEWSTRKFIGMDGLKYVCKTPKGSYFNWNQARPITTHTITLDGKEVILSDESFQALAKHFKEA